MTERYNMEDMIKHVESGMNYARSVLFIVLMLILFLLGVGGIAHAGTFKATITIDYDSCLVGDEIICPRVEGTWRDGTTKDIIIPNINMRLIENSLDIPIEFIVKNPEKGSTSTGVLYFEDGLAFLDNYIDTNKYTMSWKKKTSNYSYFIDFSSFIDHQIIDVHNPHAFEEKIKRLIDVNPSIKDRATQIWVLDNSFMGGYTVEMLKDARGKGCPVSIIHEIVITDNQGPDPEPFDPIIPIPFWLYSDVENGIGFKDKNGNEEDICLFENIQKGQYIYSFKQHWRQSEILEDGRLKCHAVQIRAIKNKPNKHQKFKNPQINLKSLIVEISGHREDDVWVIFNPETREIEERSASYMKN